MIICRVAVLLVAALSISSFSQYRKVTLLETFSNVSCDYCPDEDVPVHNLIKKHFGPLVSVRYQVDWPSPNDPMNKLAKADVQSRVNIYKIPGTPTTLFDGKDETFELSHSKIFANQGYTAPIKIDVQTSPAGSDNILSGNVVITAGSALSGSYTLHIAVIERAIIYTKAPGTNKEKEFYDVLRKLTTGSGITIPSISAGASSPYEFSWTASDASIKKDQLAVVAWVQDGSKKIINAGMSIPTYTISSAITEKSTSIKTSYTHYIPCSITNNNSTIVQTKITLRDSTKSSFTDLKLSWTPSGEFVLTDSIVASIKAGDSLIFWAVATAPSAANAKTLIEVFAENKSDPQALGWGCVRYLNLTTTADGKEFSRPQTTGAASKPIVKLGTPQIMMNGNTLSYSISNVCKVSVSLHTLNGAVIRSFSGLQRQGSHKIDLGHSLLKSGMYVIRCTFDGKQVHQIVSCLK